MAGVNFGIISSCYVVSILVNSTFGYIFFREIITKKMFLGMVITITGIIWISLAKGKGNVAAAYLIPEDDLSYYKIMSILLALSVGTLNAV